MKAINLKERHLSLSLFTIMSVFMFMSCHSGIEEVDLNDYPIESRSVHMDFKGMSDESANGILSNGLTFLFYLDGKLYQRVDKVLDNSGIAVVDVPLDESFKLIVVSGGDIINYDLESELEVTTGTEYDKEIFVSPFMSVQTNGSDIMLNLNRIVGKVGVKATDLSEIKDEGLFDSVKYKFINAITSIKLGADNEITYKDVIIESKNYEAVITSIAHPESFTDEELVRIDIDYYKENLLVGSMISPQPLSGIVVKSSVLTTLELPLIESFNSKTKSFISKFSNVTISELYNY